jgi:hypothetical protein
MPFDTIYVKLKDPIILFVKYQTQILKKINISSYATVKDL